MKYILIYYILFSQGVATGTAEFNNEPACVVARDKFNQSNSMFSTFRAICVPKGESS